MQVLAYVHCLFVRLWWVLNLELRNTAKVFTSQPARQTVNVEAPGLPVKAKWEEGTLVRILVHESLYDILAPFIRAIQDISDIVTIESVPPELAHVFGVLLLWLDAWTTEFEFNNLRLSVSFIYLCLVIAERRLGVSKFVYKMVGYGEYGMNYGERSKRAVEID